ncbi:hypothetical protein DFQ28_006219 [Apophysomyces sp. BC1034]|nr:hypothetical protein DFQ28_006219 [Apophysomyces sp. BC1034]
MEYLDLGPYTRAAGTVRLPGSKSISNRVLLLAALADGVTTIDNLLDSDDTRVMLSALEKLGVALEHHAELARCTVTGAGGAFAVKHAELFLGNAGTAVRPLTAALAVMGGEYRVHGVPRMHERPIGDLVDGLRQLGARIDYEGNPGFPPLLLHPASICADVPIRVRGDVSSQFLTALLIALPLVDAVGGTAVVEVDGELISKPYIDITIRLMERFGVHVQRDGWRRFSVPAAGRARYRSPGRIVVEGDASSASYFLAAGALAHGPVRVEGVGRASIQGDVQFADALVRMGANVMIGDDWIEARGVESDNGRLQPLDMDFNLIPDAAMTIAVAALFASGTTTLRNIGSWRVKETDRIAAMANELRKLGAHVDEGADDLRITPPDVLTPNAAIDTYDDHRMAMCFSLVSLGNVPVRIHDPGCVGKTFPDYFDRAMKSNRPFHEPVPVIAIDGPTASGKGTVAQLAAAHLGFHLLDSGALYRLAALAAQRYRVDKGDVDALVKLIDDLHITFREGCAQLDGVDVSTEIRHEAVGKLASAIAVHAPVRVALVARQRAFRKAPGLVADGRDMGTVIFTDAVLKVFLTASVEARAQRRYKQLIQKGFSVNIEDLLRDLRERDARDSNRVSAPLKPAADARMLDTSALSIGQAVDQIVGWYREMVTGTGAAKAGHGRQG